jgi:hypothetical protein
VVASGLVKVLVTSEDCEEMVLVTLGAGEALGELSIIDGGSRLACVVLPGRSGRLEALSIRHGPGSGRP